MTTSAGFTWLEKTVMTELTAGEDDISRVLCEQVRRCVVVRREYTGCGFFTHVSVSADVERINDTREQFAFADLNAEIPELEHGAGFVLWVKRGAIDCLEGFTYDDTYDDNWPKQVTGFKRIATSKAAAADSE
jgi:hypothetical protein